MEPSIFTRIINGEIPCHKIYEDEHTFAFLDIHPKQPGHVLVIPKQQVEFIWDLPTETYQELMAVAQKLGAHIREIMQSRYVGMMIEGTAVPHAHVHVFPFNAEAEYYAKADMNAEPDHAALAAVAAKLKFEQ